MRETRRIFRLVFSIKGPSKQSLKGIVRESLQTENLIAIDWGE